MESSWHNNTKIKCYSTTSCLMTMQYRVLLTSISFSGTSYNMKNMEHVEPKTTNYDKYLMAG